MGYETVSGGKLSGSFKCGTSDVAGGLGGLEVPLHARIRT